jgi:hypothetical protein
VHLDPVGEGRDLAGVEAPVEEELDPVGAAAGPGHAPPDRAPLGREVAGGDVGLVGAEHVHGGEPADPGLERAHGHAVLEALHRLRRVDDRELMDHALVRVLLGAREAELLERLAEDLLARRPPHEAHLLHGAALEPRAAHEVGERVRGSAQQLLEGGDDAERLLAAREAAPRLPVAQGRDAHGPVAGAQPLGDRGEGQPAALDGGAQLRSEPLLFVRRHRARPSSCAVPPMIIPQRAPTHQRSGLSTYL